MSVKKERHFSRTVTFQNHSILKLVSPIALSHVLSSIDEVTFAKDDFLTQENEPADALYLILQGEVCRINDGAVLSAENNFDLVGAETAHLPQYLHSARAITEVIALRIPHSTLTRLCAATPALGPSLLQCALGRDVSSHQSTVSETTNKSPVSTKLLMGWALAILFPPACFVISSHWNLTTQASLFVAIFSAVVIMWIFSLVDDYVPPLLALVYMSFVGLAPTSVIMSSFSSPSMMTLLGVFALAAMITGSGLSNRVLLWMLLRLPPRSIWYQTAMLLYGLVLSLGTPSGNNRMSLMLPAYQSIDQTLRLVPKASAATALFAATYSGAMLFSSSLATSKSATISVFGLLPHHLQDLYGGLFWVAAASGVSILLVLTHYLAARLLFSNDETGELSQNILLERLRLLGPMSPAETATALGFLAFLVGSMTTGIHHVNPAAIAGTVLIVLLVTGAMKKADLQKNIDWPMLIFLTATDCIIRTMEYLGLSTQLGAFLQGYLGFIQGQTIPFIFLALFVVLGLRLLFPIPAGMLLSASILVPVAQAEGINLWLCVFVIAVFSDIWFFPYQNSIFLIAVNDGILSKIDYRRFMQHNMVMNIMRVLAVLASLPLWYWMGLV